MGVEAFRKPWQPKVSQDLNTNIQKLEESLYEVTLKLTVDIALEEKTAVLIEAQQAGVFMVKGFEGQQLAQVLNTTCPHLLYPYLREVIDSAAVKGTFPALNLPPINFEALYAHALQQQAAQKQEAAADA